MKVEFNINKKEKTVREQSKVLKENSKTVLVKTKNGNIIKRHKIKHNVVEVLNNAVKEWKRPSWCEAN